MAKPGRLKGPADAQLYLEGDMAEPVGFELAGGTAFVFSARSPARSTENEDAAALIPFDASSAVLVVADGMGGAQGGAVASSHAVRSLEQGLAEAAREGRALRTAILDAVERAQESVADLGVGAATTLAAVEVGPDRVRPYHVGDSGILLVGQRGKLKLQSVSHSPVGFAVEAGVLDERDAIHHAERHLVSNVLGHSDMRIEVGSSRPLAARDTLLLASDGLFDNLHRDEVIDTIRRGPLERAARQLVAECRRRMETPAEGEPSKPDDLTLILFRRSASRS